MGTYRIRCLIVIALGVCGAVAHAQRYAVEFDGGVETSGGATFSFSRASLATGRDGSLIPFDQPRFAPPTLLCGRADTTHVKSGLSINALALGAGEDGAPIYVINTNTTQRLSVHFGEGSVERAIGNGDWTGAYRLVYRDPGKGDQSNLLYGQSDGNAGTPDQPNMLFKPNNGASFHNGLITLGADVFEREGDLWFSRRVALLYTTVDRLSQQNPWIVAALGEDTGTVDLARGAPWSYSSFPISDGEFVMVWADYRNPVKTGGTAYATRFVRQVDGSWTPTTIEVGRSESPWFSLHWHCGGLIRHDDGRWSILVSTGDGIGDNEMLATTRSAGGAWASSTVIPDTGLDERSVVYAPSADWSALETVWGGIGGPPYLRHNQVISMIAADKEGSALLCGTDETSSGVLRLDYDPDTRIPRWTTAYLPSVTSYPGDGVLNFSMQGAPGGPYLGRIDAASTSGWQAGQRESRVLYSPDGVHWGQCMVAGTTGSRQANLLDGVGYIGSLADETAGFRRIAEPQAELVRPLMVSASTDNWLRESEPGAVDGLDAGVTIERIGTPADLPPGVPPPPCDQGNVFLVENRSETGMMGHWRLVSDLPDVPGPPKGTVLVRAWVYALGPEDAGDPATTAQMAFRFWDEAGGRVDTSTGRLDFDSGAWTPVSLWGTFAGPDEIGMAPDLPWRPTITLRARNSGDINAPSRFLIAWEGVYPGAPTSQGYGLPPQQVGAGEHAQIDGLALGDDWTVLMVGMVPDDEWDNRVGGTEGPLRTSTSHINTLLTLEGHGGSYVRVMADPSLEGVRVSASDGVSERETRSVRDIYWLRGSPVVGVLRSREGVIRLDYSIGNSETRLLSLTKSVSPTRAVLGPDPLWWRRLEAVPFAVEDDQLDKIFQTQTLPCQADYDGNGVVDSRDLIGFISDWAEGSTRADFNRDGVIDSRDVIAFLTAYAAGC